MDRLLEKKKQKTWTAVLMGLHHRVGSIRGFSRTRHRVAAKIRRNENGQERSENPLTVKVTVLFCREREWERKLRMGKRI